MNNSARAENLKPWRIILFSVLFSLFTFYGNAQQVEAAVDTSTIKIGEQITYRITVEADSSNLVVFPEGQTFAPLEVVESFGIDTSRSENEFRLIKKYALTQFDSGSYTIPQQRLIINNRLFLTDSILVEVRDVPVDTTKQKLFPIKPSIEIPPKNEVPEWVFWALGAMILLGLLTFLYFRRKKKKEAAARKLPPYEQALFELEQLDKSHLLEDREIKEYYSQLSGAVRRYLDEEVYDHAMESTSGELISYLIAEKRAGKLQISEETIQNLQVILGRSDLAKFANSKPDVITAKEDRKRIEGIINDTKSSIPEPTEEELLRNEEYRRKKAKKKKRKKIIIGAVVTVAILVALTTYLVSTKGFSYLQETLFGNPTKELLQEEWIRSEYGKPPVAITTPKVLIRNMNDTLSDSPLFLGKESFKTGTVFGNYFVDLSTFEINQGAEFNLETVVDGLGSYLEKLGASNIILKQEEISTINEAQGVKVFGAFQIENPVTEEPVKKKYAILNFTAAGGYQQIVLIYDEDDTYADVITERIINSVELLNLNETETELDFDNTAN